MGYYLDLVLPRSAAYSKKKTRAVYNNTMEEYEDKVIKLHATLFQIISKLTGNISKFTSNSTSKTGQIRLGGGCRGAWVGEYTRERLVRL